MTGRLFNTDGVIHCERCRASDLVSVDW